MQTNSSTTGPRPSGRVKFARFSLGQTFITPGAQEALQIAGQTELEFLRRHMSGDWGSELSEEDVQENELSLRKGFRLLSAYQTGKGQKLFGSSPKPIVRQRPCCCPTNTNQKNRRASEARQRPLAQHTNFAPFREKD